MKCGNRSFCEKLSGTTRAGVGVAVSVSSGVETEGGRIMSRRGSHCRRQNIRETKESNRKQEE